VVSTIVFHFVLFGVIVQCTGFGQLFINNATIFAGRYTGESAKVSVASLAYFGTISGSSVANTVFTGALTIPNLKRLGYPGHFAGGVEAASSAGGQITPRIMGAAAFSRGLGRVVAPMAFVYASVLLFVSSTGFDLQDFGYTETSCIAGVMALFTAVFGYLFTPMGTVSRILMAIAGLVFVTPSLAADLVALVIASPVIVSQIPARRSTRTPA